MIDIKKTYKERVKSKNKESGNMVLALFAAVAMVGTIGAGTTMVMRGPMKVMSDVNQRAITESQLLLSSKMMMLDTGNLAQADCDGDKLNEPREWKTGAGPANGGLIPDSVGTSKQDTWGTPYGYCVWDHGALNQADQAGCGGVGQRRLRGGNSIEYPVVAIISAGPNGTFETPCNHWVDVAPADGKPDTPLVAKDDSNDDMVMVYSYAEASKDNPGLWNLTIDANGNVRSTITDGDIDSVNFTGSNTAFGGNLALTGTEGLFIPDVGAVVCDASLEGEIRRDMSGPSLVICEDTGGSVYDWVPLSTGGSGGGSGEITINHPGPGCVPMIETMSVADSLNNATTISGPGHIEIRGNYAFLVSNGSDGIVSFDISDPYNIVELDNVFNAATMNNPRQLAIQGNYAYVTAKDSDSLTIFDISDPANMVEKDTYTSANIDNAYTVAVSGDYAYVTSASHGIVSFDISDPDNIVELDTVFNSTTMNFPESLTLSGNYVYVSGILSDSLTIIDVTDPTNMVEKGSITHATDLDRADNVIVDGDFAYVISIEPATFTIIDVSNPDSPTKRGTLSGMTGTVNSADSVKSGNYIFVTGRDNDDITIIDVTDPDNPIEVGRKVFDIAILDQPWGLAIKDNFLYALGHDSETITSIDVCGEGYQGQVTVNQTADGGTTLGSVGWAQTLASDTSNDEAGIAFVVDPYADKASAPLAAIVAKRGSDPADMVFKTKDTDGKVDGSTYFDVGSRVGVEMTTGVDSWKYGNIYAELQIGVHDPANWNSVVYEHGLLVTTNTSGTDQMAYFGFEGENDASGVVMFSKDLKIKKIDMTGSNGNEYLRFESDQATTFFGNIVQKSESADTRLVHKSYSNNTDDDGELILRKTRGNEGTQTVVANNDVLGEVKFGVDTFSSKAIRMKSVVNGAVSDGNLPNDLIFSAGKGSSCTVNEGGPFAVAGSDTTLSSAWRVWGDGSYLYAINRGAPHGLHAYSFDGTIFTKLNSYSLTDPVHHVWSDGTYIYVANAFDGIRAFSFNGSSFTLLDTFDTPARAIGIWGDGTYIYVADNISGVRAYTFDGSTFTEVGSFNTPYSALDVWGDGTYIYVADDQSGIRAYTFDGSTFTELASFDTTDSAMSVWGNGAYVYVADQSGGLYVFSFDGTTFTELDNDTSTGDVTHVWSDGIYIYAATNNTGIHAFEFDGTSLSIVDDYNTSGLSRGVWGDGTYIYLADGTTDVVAFSGFACTGSAAEMRFTSDGEWTVGGVTPEAKFHSNERMRTDEGLRIGNDTTCAAAKDVGVLRYVGTPTEPFEVCDGTNWVGLSNYTTEVSPIEDGLNCSPLPFDFTDVSDISTSTQFNSNTILIGGIDAGETCKMTVASEGAVTINLNGTDQTGEIVDVENGDRIYLKVTSSGTAGGNTAVYTSIGDKTDEMITRSSCTHGFTEDDSISTVNLDEPVQIVRRGDIAYVAVYNVDALTTIDISDPSNLVEMDSVTSAGLWGAWGVTVYGNYAYVAARNSSNIVSVDISDPNNLVESDVLSSTHFNDPITLKVHDGVLYVVSKDSDKVVSVDISDPTNMSVLDNLTTANLDGPHDIDFAGDHAFVTAIDGDNFVSIDISNPSSMSESDSISSTDLDQVAALDIVGNYAFVAAYGATSVTAIDISDPSNMAFEDTYTAATNLNGAYDIEVVGPYAYVAARISDRLTMLDISDVTNITELTSLNAVNLGTISGLVYKDGYVYAAAYSSDAITSVQVDCP